MPLSGRDLLHTIKGFAGLPGPTLGLPVGCPAGAWLRPVATRRELLDPRDVRVLTEWRNRFVNAFLTEFVATEPQTERWLIETVGKGEDRILFMVDDLERRTFGYMGLAFIDWDQKYGEADAIVRGGTAPPGMMTEALRTLLDWARGQLGLEHIGVRVRSDNSALEFYRKFGFREVRRVPLRKRVEGARIIWEENSEAATAEPSLVHLVLPDKTAYKQEAPPQS